MSNPASDRLLADGIALTLRNGDQTKDVKLRYGMRGIKMLEDDFGSLEQAIDTMSNLGEKNAKRVDLLMKLLAAGLQHERLTADELLDWTDFVDLKDYVTAIEAALNQAFPPSTAEGTSPNDEGTKQSPGTTSTTSPPSDSGEATASSGA